MTFLGFFCLLMWLSLRASTQVWSHTSGREEALRHLTKARMWLCRDLANASSLSQHYGTAQFGPSLGAGFDGDALSVFTCSDENQAWNITVDGSSVWRRQICYFLAVPNGVSSLYGVVCPGVADSLGYEQACPYKWLVRRVDPLPVSVADPVLPSNWPSAMLSRPSSLAPTARRQVVATLLGFRILSRGKLWRFELKACASEDARRQIELGTVPLAASRFTLVQQFSVTVNN